MKRFFIPILFSVFVVIFGIYSSVYAQGIGTIPQLQQFVSTTSPSSAITQQVYGKSLKITGLTTGLCLTLDANNILTTTTCGTGGGGSPVYPFTAQTYGASTSTTIGFLQGLFSVGSTTVGSLNIPSLSDGILKIVSGLVSVASNGTDYTLITAKDCTGSGHVVSITASGNVTCSADSGGGGAGTGTISTTTPLVSGQVDFSTGVSTIGNDSSFLFNNVSKLLTFNYSTSTLYSSFTTASTTNLLINGQSFNNLLGTGLSNVGGALTNSGVISLGNGTGTTCSGTNPGTCNVNASQSISTLSNLSTNGLVTTSGSNGTLGVTVNGTGGFVLGMANGIPTWLATTTYSGGLTYLNGNVTNSGVTSILAGSNISVSGATGAVTITGLAFPFTINTGYNSTTTAIGFTGANSLFATGSTTLSGAVHRPTILSSFLGTDSVGNEYGLASSSIKLSTLNNDIAFTTAASKWATSSIESFTIVPAGASYVSIGTTTSAKSSLTVSTSTVSQLTLTDNNNTNAFNFRDAGNSFFIATSSPTTYATSTNSVFTINTNGYIGIASTSPGSLFSINNVVNFDPATTSFSSVGGINLKTGCFSIAGVCVAGGSGGSGTVNDILQGTGFVNQGTHLTISGTLTSAFASGTTPTIGRLAMFSSTGSGSTSILLTDVATGTVTCAGTASCGGTSSIIGPNLTITGTGLATHDEYTHAFTYQSATSSLMAIGTTTSQIYQTTIASSTVPQLSLGDGTAGDAQFTFRTAGQSLYVSTTTTQGTATTSTPALELNGNGKPAVAVSSSSPNSTLTIEGRAGDYSNLMFIGSSTEIFRVNNSGQIFAPNTTTQSGAATDYWCYDSNSQFIRVSAICTTSALKFKKDITPLHQGLDTVMAMKPVNYYLNDLGITDPKNADQHAQQIGFIADYEATTTPLLIIHDGQGEIHGFNYEQYTAILTKAIQELNAKVEQGQNTFHEHWQDVGIFLLLCYVIYNEYEKIKTRK